MIKKYSGAGLCVFLMAGPGMAEPTPADINGYFNPRPDAYVDLDAIVDLQYRKDMSKGSSIADVDLDYDQHVQDENVQTTINANGAVALRKSDGLDFGLSGRFRTQNYSTQSGSGVDGLGSVFSFIDAGTADPRSFWFASFGLGFGARSGADNGDDNNSAFGLEVGLGRGRVYSNISFHRAWALAEKLSASGVFLGTPSTEQLYGLARVFDKIVEYSRMASDESHGLGKLGSIRSGEYTRRWYKEIWLYLVQQGLVSGSADIDSVFDMRYVFGDRGYQDWNGGAQVTTGLEFLSKNEAGISTGFGGSDSLFRDLLGINDPTAGSAVDDRVSVFVNYEQHWPLDIRTGINAGARLAFTDDSLLATRLNAGYLKELSDYLFLTHAAEVAISLDSDDSFIGIKIGSELEYELSPTASLIAVGSAATGTEIDFDYSVDVKLAFDLM